MTEPMNFTRQDIASINEARFADQLFAVKEDGTLPNKSKITVDGATYTIKLSNNKLTVSRNFSIWNWLKGRTNLKGVIASKLSGLRDRLQADRKVNDIVAGIRNKFSSNGAADALAAKQGVVFTADNFMLANRFDVAVNARRLEDYGEFNNMYFAASRVNPFNTNEDRSLKEIEGNFEQAARAARSVVNDSNKEFVSKEFNTAFREAYVNMIDQGGLNPLDTLRDELAKLPDDGDRKQVIKNFLQENMTNKEWRNVRAQGHQQSDLLTTAADELDAYLRNDDNKTSQVTVDVVKELTTRHINNKVNAIIADCCKKANLTMVNLSQFDVKTQNISVAKYAMPK